MAVLDNSDFTEIAQFIRNSPNKAEFKAAGFSKADWKALFQAAEDWFVGAFNTTPTTSFKGALDAVVTTTSGQAQAIGKVWMNWRFSK